MLSAKTRRGVDIGEDELKHFWRLVVMFWKDSWGLDYSGVAG